MLVASIICACATKSKLGNYPAPSSNMALVEESANISSDDSHGKAIGGWAPVFFAKYDQAQLSDIAAKMEDGVVKKVIVSYPKKMQPLAKKIQSYLQQTTSQKVTMDYLELKNTDQVSYNMSQVIVTLYF